MVDTFHKLIAGLANCCSWPSGQSNSFPAYARERLDSEYLLSAKSLPHSFLTRFVVLVTKLSKKAKN